jgi:hypothetical protein
MFLTGSMVSSSVGKKVREKAVWRTDMDTFVLELMRRRVVDGLVYLIERKRGYLAGCVDWDDAKRAGRQQAAILWIGSASSDGQEAADSESEAQPIRSQLLEEAGPPSFATLTISKDKPHMVPVHNLLTMLGAEHLAELRKRGVSGDLLVLKHKRITVGVQMKLWKLQGYLGFPEPEYTPDFLANWKLERKKHAGSGPEGLTAKQQGKQEDDEKSHYRLKLGE